MEHGQPISPPHPPRTERSKGRRPIGFVTVRVTELRLWLELLETMRFVELPILCILLHDGIRPLRLQKLLQCDIVVVPLEATILPV